MQNEVWTKVTGKYKGSNLNVPRKAVLSDGILTECSTERAGNTTVKSRLLFVLIFPTQVVKPTLYNRFSDLISFNSTYNCITQTSLRGSDWT